MFQQKTVLYIALDFRIISGKMIDCIELTEGYHITKLKGFVEILCSDFSVENLSGS